MAWNPERDGEVPPAGMSADTGDPAAPAGPDPGALPHGLSGGSDLPQGSDCPHADTPQGGRQGPQRTPAVGDPGAPRAQGSPPAPR